VALKDMGQAYKLFMCVRERALTLACCVALPWDFSVGGAVRACARVRVGAVVLMTPPCMR
jgi:hypothetical protein